VPTTERSEVPPPLMPFLLFPRICSFSGRSGGISVDMSQESSAYHLIPTHPFMVPTRRGWVGSGAALLGLKAFEFLPGL
jgi:hypothetical protein